MSEKEFKRQRKSGQRQNNRTIITTPRSWFHFGHDGSIHVVNQRFGQQSTGQVRLTRAEFERFVKFYERGKHKLAA